MLEELQETAIRPESGHLFPSRTDLRIVLDENIVEFERFLGLCGSVTAMAGSEITNRVLLEEQADVLVVRSVTRVDAELLTGTGIRFVGSATAGIDHVDTAYLGSRGITFRHAPGSNAESVAEYVLAVLLRLAAITGTGLEGRSLGVVGYGQTGSRVADRGRRLGMRVVATDPPLADRGMDGLVSLEEVFECDVISLHVPLTTQGPWPTFHMIDDAALGRLKPEAWIVNASRGAVIDGRALGAWIHHSPRARVALDVWENEPVPDPRLIDTVHIASPHIAGYSYDGKVAGTVMIAKALMAWSEGALPNGEIVPDEGPVHSSELTQLIPATRPWEIVEDVLDRIVACMYDIRIDDAAMRELVTLDPEERARKFQALRRNYPSRRTFRSYSISLDDLPVSRFPSLPERLDALGCVVLNGSRSHLNGNGHS